MQNTNYANVKLQKVRIDTLNSNEDQEFSFTEYPPSYTTIGYEETKYKYEIEKVWKELDNYNKGYLDIDEARFFMDELVPIIGSP